MMKQFANSQTCSEHLLLRTCNHLTELALFISSLSHLTYLHLLRSPSLPTTTLSSALRDIFAPHNRLPWTKLTTCFRYLPRTPQLAYLCQNEQPFILQERRLRKTRQRYRGAKRLGHACVLHNKGVRIQEDVAWLLPMPNARAATSDRLCTVAMIVQERFVMNFFS